ncbi:heavy metal-binding protein [Virgibacillus dokdonensis]|uniref:Heavy metal-binding protein n=1 Tax=Virgibacillus dokdonensis TaxID=302167 RepID=A0A3E0WPQ6_9BACI|nr:heavy-metal-associated domain-containing protein [Virgibacillus dokdonensis]RFA33945.1 heavy metal-binding protein [Virgibacillus dokdonensis]
MAKAILQLEPLTCPSCIKKIETALGKESGVQSVRVLFNASKVKMEFDDQKIDGEQLAEKISKLGYVILNQKLT